jgi:hypothetical protein
LNRLSETGRDKTVQREFKGIFSGRQVLLEDTERVASPYGGLAVFVEFLNRIGYLEAVRKHMPVRLTSHNAIAPEETFTAFLVSVLVGARRFAHAGLLRLDRALHSLLGLARFPTDDTIRNLFRRFTQGKVTKFYEGLTSWQIERLPEREEGYSLDLDSTVFTRYGEQEGAFKGYNPHKPGRLSHHPILAVLAEAHFFLHGWLRSGNCASGRGVSEFLTEALALLGDKRKIRMVRADSGFFDDKFLRFLQERSLPYVVVAKMTRRIKSEAHYIREWRELDSKFSAGEFRAKLQGWDCERRIVVIRELIGEKPSKGRLLLDLPGYTFRMFVTSTSLPPEDVWREYNHRADMENRICELKHDLAADGFCMKGFYETEAAFRGILLLFNLLGEFQRAAGLLGYQQPATLRTQIFLCGAILGVAGRNMVLYLSSAWGGLKRRIPLFDNIMAYVFPASPKLPSDAPPAPA